jgi:hypothetical protein
MNIIFKLKDMSVVKPMSKGFASQFYSSGHAWKVIEDGLKFADINDAVRYCKDMKTEHGIPYYLYTKYRNKDSKFMESIATYILELDNGQIYLDNTR